MNTPIFGADCGDCSAVYDVTGEIDSDDLSVAMVLPVDAATLALQIAGTWTATLLFEGTINGDDWISMQMQPQPSGAHASQATVNGSWQVNVAGYAKFRVRAASATGTAEISMRVSPAGATLPVPAVAAGSTVWVRSDVTLTGAGDDKLVDSDINRRAVVFYNRPGNSLVEYDLAGTNLVNAGEGITLLPGGPGHAYSGDDTPQGIVTARGAAGNIVTVYTRVET